MDGCMYATDGWMYVCIFLYAQREREIERERETEVGR